MYNQHLQKIQLLLERNKFDLAQKALIEALGDYPNDDQLLGLQAELYLQNNDLENALSTIKNAIVNNPENDWLYYVKSKIHFTKRHWKYAEEEINRALELNPYQAQYHGLLSNTLYNMERTDAALNAAKQGLSIDPDNIICNNLLTMCLNRKGEKGQAAEQIEQMLERDPESALTHATTAYHFLRSNNIKKAKEHFAISLQKDPEFEYAREGMMHALKSTNFLYRYLMQFSFWMQQLGSKNSWFLIIGLLIIVNTIPILIPFYLVLVLWTWFTPPLSDIILFFDKYGRYLMTPFRNKLTLLNSFLLILAIISIFSSIYLNAVFLNMAFALFFAIIPIHYLNLTESNGNRLILACISGGFIGLGVWGVSSTLMGQANNQAWIILYFGVIAFSWLGRSLID